MIQALNWRAALGIASGLITIVGAVPYFLDTAKGLTKPNAGSWLMWLLATSVAVTAQLLVGFSWATIVIAAATFNALVIFILALKSGKWQFGLFDWLALVAVLLAIGLGWTLHSAIIVVVLAVTADALVSLPVSLKALRQPSSETVSSYLWFGAAAVLSILSVGQINVLYILYPTFFIVSDFSIGLTGLLASRRSQAKAK